MENHLGLFSSISPLREALLWNEGRLGKKRGPTGAFYQSATLVIFEVPKQGVFSVSAFVEKQNISAFWAPTSTAPDAFLQLWSQKVEKKTLWIFWPVSQCFGEMCGDWPSLNAWGLAGQHSAGVICYCFQGTLAKFCFFAAGRVNAVYGVCMGGGKEICT